MPSYQRFEDLPVWQKSADLAALMFRWTNNSEFRGQGDLANQLQRATLSISNNIAKGFERGSTNDLLKFLYIARGSAGEVRSMLCVIDRMEGFQVLKSEVANLKSEFESVSRQLRAWADSLQNGEIAGQRHLNDRSRQEYQGKLRKTEFLDQQSEFRKQMAERLDRKAKTEQKKKDGP